MMVSFCAVFFPRGVLDEILNLIESVSEGFPSYFSIEHSLSLLNPNWNTIRFGPIPISRSVKSFRHHFKGESFLLDWGRLFRPYS